MRVAQLLLLMPEALAVPRGAEWWAAITPPKHAPKAKQPHEVVSLSKGSCQYGWKSSAKYCIADFLVNAGGFSKASCEAACTKQAACKAYTYYLNGWCQTVSECSAEANARDTSANTFEKDLETGCRFNPKGGAAAPQCYEPKSTGKYCVSHFLVNDRGYTRAQCEAACSREPKCAAYTSYSDVWCQNVAECRVEGKARDRSAKTFSKAAWPSQ